MISQEVNAKLDTEDRKQFDKSKWSQTERLTKIWKWEMFEKRSRKDVSETEWKPNINDL